MPLDQRIVTSRNLITHAAGWVIDETTFRVIDERATAWVALATTSHMHKEGLPEATFAILAERGSFLTIDPSLLPAIGQWIAEQTEKKEGEQ